MTPKAELTMWGVTAHYEGAFAIEYMRSLIAAYDHVLPIDKEEWIKLCVIHTHPLPGASVRPCYWWDLPTHLLINQASHKYKLQQFVGSKS